MRAATSQSSGRCAVPAPDVVAVAEVVPRALDEAVIELAILEDRVVLTEDKDFGQLVYGSGRPSVCEAGAFTIVQPGRVRIRRL